ncbi:unnamed protein product [Schistosoma curassoni]|uniref:Uncharacterized protein n=1 Tax=Schistosoma curassoni TaxID=6186 RepID=A0A183JE32_9TREM|nr:unnamed protein product [Schistosoma curassoni]
MADEQKTKCLPTVYFWNVRLQNSTYISLRLVQKAFPNENCPMNE